MRGTVCACRKTLNPTNTKVTMSLKVIAVAISLLAVNTSGMASQFMEKNNLPCLVEICIGDGIAELAKVQWTPAQVAYKVNNKTMLMGDYKLNDDEVRHLKAIFPNAGEAAPYLHGRTFDAGALPALSRVPAACQPNELIGTFGMNTETPTRVGISLTPSLTDPTKHTWKVTTIAREYPSVTDNGQRAEITKQLSIRYGKFGAGNKEVADKPGEGRFLPGGTARFGFGLSMYRGEEEASRMKLHPACAAVEKTASR